MSDEERKFWIDCLHEKHECWTYENFRTSIPLKVGRRKVQLHMPSGFDKVEILFTAEREGILFILARNLSKWAQEMWCDGILMVAKRLENGDYAVAIWHELYGYALKHLGLR
ncbi:MAG: hypothetical protein RMK89_11335 [Armatimonadota bacterium]|nr:hypothetical protein [Armatimonadota bacterium]MDW8144042.1 hypothetical protein [Armatimonadota bacterium]